MQRRFLTALFCGATVALAGCGGGSSPLAPMPVPTSQPAKTPDAYVVLRIPPKHITAKYISPAVQGVDFTVTPGTTAGGQFGYVFYPISSTQPYCTVPSGGGLTCTLALVAPPGTDTITVNTYDEPAPSQTSNGVYSNMLSTGTITTTISANAQNTINVVTDGTPSFVLQRVDNMYPALGAPFSEALHVEALDADGYYIVGTYSSPIALSVTNSSAVTVSPATVPDSTTAGTVMLSYNGSVTVPSYVNVQAEIGGFVYNSTPQLFIGQTGLNLAPGTLVFAHSNSATQSAVLSGVGVTPAAPYTLYSWESVNLSNVSTQPACSSATFAMGTNTSGAPVLNVTPVSAGSCSIQVADANGHSAAVDVLVSP